MMQCLASYCEPGLISNHKLHRHKYTCTCVDRLIQVEIFLTVRYLIYTIIHLMKGKFGSRHIT